MIYLPSSISYQTYTSLSLVIQSINQYMYLTMLHHIDENGYIGLYWLVFTMTKIIADSRGGLW